MTSTLAVATVAAAATPASATTAPCAGYTYRGKIAIHKPLLGGPVRTVGYAYWYQKSYAHSASRVCAVTRPAAAYAGRTRWLYVQLDAGNGTVRDGGPYRYYAGPVVVARTGSVDLWAEVELATSAGGQRYYTEVGALPN